MKRLLLSHLATHPSGEQADSFSDTPTPRRWLDLALGGLLGAGLSMAFYGLAAHAAPLASSQKQLQKSLKKIQKSAEFLPGQLVVKMRTQSLSTQSIARTLETALGSNTVYGIEPLQTDKSTLVVKTNRGEALASAIAQLKKDPNVEIAEPNFIYRAIDDGEGLGAGLPNDPDLSKTWGIRNSGQADSSGQAGTAGSDVGIVPLWQKGFTGSRKVLVAVIDTGIDWEHPDLKDNLYTNPGEAGALAENGKDDDNNGFVDDLHGWNFATKTRLSMDDHNHGTHCSGTIGGVGNNGQGVTGVSWQVSLLPVKFLNADGSGSLSAAVDAINYARMMKVNIMSNSWGGGGFSEQLKKAIEDTKDAGILFVAAAGNDSSNNDTTPTYPAAYGVDNIVAVAATDNQDRLAPFSNFGAKSVHVAAPGVRVYSTVLKGPDGTKYGVFSGTSMATPHVAGVAAVLLAGNPGWGYDRIKDRLIATSDPVSGLRKRVLARGRVNAYNAFYGIVPPSNEPDEKLWKTERRLIESAHPYQNSDDTVFEVKVPGAKFIRLIFDRVEVEENYDKVIIENGAGETTEELTGRVSGYTTDYIKGEKAVVRLRADESNTGYGFRIETIQYIQ